MRRRRMDRRHPGRVDSDPWVYSPPCPNARGKVAAAVVVVTVSVLLDSVAAARSAVECFAKVLMELRAIVLPLPHSRLRNMPVVDGVRGLGADSSRHVPFAFVTTLYAAGTGMKALSHSVVSHTGAHGLVNGASAAEHRHHFRPSSPSLLSRMRYL
jgi:hypothetical protein